MINQLAPYVAVLVLLAGCKASCFAPKAKRIDSQVAATLSAQNDERNAAPEPSDAKFDHSAFQTLLEKHVRYDSGRVDYAALKEDEDELKAYSARLEKADLGSLSPASQKALLINAYNAFTLQLILDNYPGIESIKEIDSPWKTKRWTLDGDSLSLDDIEHGLLRPIYKDPRIHFAVNCAAIGCPRLADFAYTGAELDEQLERVSKATLRHPDYARVEKGKLRLTAVMNWYGDDFTKEGWDPRAESLPEFAARYGTAEMKALVDEHGADTPVDFIDYDWTLNDVSED